MRDRLVIVDIATRRFKSVSFKQYDRNNLLQIVLYENKKIVDVSNYVAIAYFETPSGNVIKINTSIQNNTINVLLSENVLKEYGRVKTEIELLNEDQIVTTFALYLNVEKSINKVSSSTDTEHIHLNKDVLDQITQEMIDSILLGGGMVDLSSYQTRRDINLNTTDKTVVGAINELNDKIGNNGNVDLSEYARKEEVPTKTSQLINDSGFLNGTEVENKIANAQLSGGNVDLSGYATKDELNAKADKTEIANLDIPTKTSELTNDSGFLTNIPSEYVTETELTAKGYATQTDVNTALNNKVDIEAGKGLSTNDFTNDLKTKLDGIASGAEVNVQSDWNVTDTTSDAYILNKPDLTTYATKTFVSDEVAKAVTGGTVDLSGYAKVDDVGDKTNLTTTEKTTIVGAINEISDKAKANTTSMATKANQTDVTALGARVDALESLNAEENVQVDWNVVDTSNDAFIKNKPDLTLKADKTYVNTELAKKVDVEVGKSLVSDTEIAKIHTHDNKIVLDNLTQTVVDDSHKHTNKTILDTITQDKIDGWNKAEENVQSDWNETNTTSDAYIKNKPNLSELGADLSLNGSTLKLKNTDGDEIGVGVELPSNYVTKDELKTKANVSDIPTKTSQLQNDSGYLTEHQNISGKADKSYVDAELTKKSDKSHTHSYDDLSDKPVIPSIDNLATKKELTDGLVTKSNTGHTHSQYLTEHQDISGKADKSEIPTKTSQLSNDSGYMTSIPSEYITESELNAKGYLTSIPSEYITETELESKGYLTEHQDISGKADKLYVDTELAKKSDKTHTHSYNDLSDKPIIPSIDGLATKEELTDGLATKSDTTHTHDQYLTEHQDLSDYALKTELPTVLTKTSQLTNDSNFISSIPEEYITETELQSKGFATESFVTDKISEAQLGGSGSEVDLSGYVTKDIGNANQITFSDGETIQAKLDNNSLKGEDGVGIASIVNYYRASSLSSGVTKDAPVAITTFSLNENNVSPQSDQDYGWTRYLYYDASKNLLGYGGSSNPIASESVANIKALDTSGSAVYFRMSVNIPVRYSISNNYPITQGKYGFKTDGSLKMESSETHIKTYIPFADVDGATLSWVYDTNNDTNDEPELATYTVTNNLTNCTNSNTNTNTKEGSSYRATITADNGYKMSNITVTMGGANITSSSVSGNVITINNVTGDIVITASAIVDTSDEQWTTDVQMITPSKRYLWNYVVITLTDGSQIETEPCVIGVYGDSGSSSGLVIPSDLTINSNNLLQLKDANGNTIGKGTTVSTSSITDEEVDTVLSTVFGGGSSSGGSSSGGSSSGSSNISVFVNNNTYTPNNNIISLPNYITFPKGKKITILGDSITYGYDGTDASLVSKPYPLLVQNLLGASSVYNYGMSGSTIGGGGSSTSVKGSTPMNIRYTDMLDADYILVLGGVNDYCASTVPLGTKGDSTNQTFYGALKILIEGLINKYPSGRIGFMTPLRKQGDTVANNQGSTLKEYRNAIIEMCEDYCIPVLDLYTKGGCHPENATWRTNNLPDGLHPNQSYYEKLARQIASFILSL